MACLNNFIIGAEKIQTEGFFEIESTLPFRLIEWKGLYLASRLRSITKRRPELTTTKKEANETTFLNILKKVNPYTNSIYEPKKYVSKFKPVHLTLLKKLSPCISQIDDINYCLENIANTLNHNDTCIFLLIGDLHV